MSQINNPEDDDISPWQSSHEVPSTEPTAAPPSSPLPLPPAPQVTGPRLITAEEVLAERAEQRREYGYFPHGQGERWSSAFWVSCDCPNCRDNYDPTGEETAKYLNMEYPSFFNGQGEKPSFSFSKIVKSSYLAHLKPGFYIGNAKKPATLDDVVLVQSPPLALKPKRILHNAENRDWDEFVLSDDRSHWVRRSYVKGRYVSRLLGDKEDPDMNIPFAALPNRLREIFGV